MTSSGSTEWGAVHASSLFVGERRLEAATYLSDGFGRRIAIESRPSGWTRFEEVADIWQPSRLKGIVVDPAIGTPFLSAGQVYEAQPASRKYLSFDKTPDATSRFVNHGTILLSCSGSVGRVTVAYRKHENHIITHDLLRVQPRAGGMQGWIYAYMRTATFKSIATATHYGHMIKHLEPEHVQQLPYIHVDSRTLSNFANQFGDVLRSRDEATELTDEAYDLYASGLGTDSRAIEYEPTFVVQSREMCSGRRRLDAYHHNPAIQTIASYMRKAARTVETLEDVTARVWWPNRFRRVFGDDGTPYVSAGELFDVNAQISKYIYAGRVPNSEDYFVEPHWILMARSGQIYGLNGRVILTSDRHTHFFVSEDIIRIVPDHTKIRAGYLEAVLSHPTLGRPVVLGQSYGTSVPHIEPSDVLDVPVPRLDPRLEYEIAERIEHATLLRAHADDVEDDMQAKADETITRFLRG